MAQAFGIPALGVRQPGHVCTAYKSADPALQPQVGNVWKIVYGRDWHVSKVQGLPGLEFLAGIKKRMRTAEFAQVERLRWFASSRTSQEPAAAVMSIVRKSEQSAPRGGELPSKGDPPKKPSGVIPRPEPPFRPRPGVLHVEAETYVKASGQGSFKDWNYVTVCIYQQGVVIKGKIQYSVFLVPVGYFFYYMPR